MSSKILAIILSILLFVLVVELVRRERLTFKYAFAWLAVAVLGIFLAIFDSVIARIAVALGFQVASNFVFFSCVFAGVFLTLSLTIFLCQQNIRNDQMAQKIGLLEQEVEELKQKTR